MVKNVLLREEWLDERLNAAKNEGERRHIRSKTLRKDMAIICEHTGLVDFMHCCTHDAGNSMMGLFFTGDPSEELVMSRQVQQHCPLCLWH